MSLRPICCCEEAPGVSCPNPWTGGFNYDTNNIDDVDIVSYPGTWPILVDPPDEVMSPETVDYMRLGWGHAGDSEPEGFTLDSWYAGRSASGIDEPNLFRFWHQKTNYLHHDVDITWECGGTLHEPFIENYTGSNDRIPYIAFTGSLHGGYSALSDFGNDIVQDQFFQFQMLKTASDERQFRLLLCSYTYNAGWMGDAPDPPQFFIWGTVNGPAWTRTDSTTDNDFHFQVRLLQNGSDNYSWTFNLNNVAIPILTLTAAYRASVAPWFDIPPFTEFNLGRYWSVVPCNNGWAVGAGYLDYGIGWNSLPTTSPVATITDARGQSI